jgi:hypothetical protein
MCYLRGYGALALASIFSCGMRSISKARSILSFYKIASPIFTFFSNLDGKFFSCRTDEQ